MLNGLNQKHLPALLALEDGSVFPCRSFTGHGEAGGEIVFNTSMMGYQEILSDPSYNGQIVVMTYPLIGNYGINREDMESRRIQTQAILTRECIDCPSNHRSEETLAEFLGRHRVLGVCNLDTRAVTLRIRDKGAMRAYLSTLEMNGRRLVAKARRLPPMQGRNLSVAASTRSPFRWENGVISSEVALPLNENIWRFRNSKPAVAVLDFGVKHNILRMLEQNGCEVVVIPATTDAQAILSLRPNGLLVSNGPGDPKPVVEPVETLRAILGAVPMFGICLGHQLLALALGAKTFKLKFGHRGSNQPVLNVRTRRVEITSQNHGFAIEEESLKRTGAEITHINLNDRTVEGFRYGKYMITSVQYHPEASPGPRDANHLFKEFYKQISDLKKIKKNL